jgi:mono/diheme cytochrome c family protein
MKMKLVILALVLVLLSAIHGIAEPHKKDGASKDGPRVAAVHRSEDGDAVRVEGEQKFRANCGRCHAAPQKFPPRMMATVVRHMRVRATITDQEMQSILRYLTQ